MLIKKELVNLISERYPKEKKKDISAWIDIVLEGIEQACVENEGVRFTNFGTFFIKEYDSRIARNPKTMEEVIIEPYKAVRFKASDSLKNKVNGK